jgi:glyoxylase-like metal-dependent hydrolase (beta-lactamase superfamily II)
MPIYHLNCGSMAPRFPRMQVIVYCLLVETNQGLLLVDTGFGTGDCTHPAGLMRLFAAYVGAPLDIEETAVRQVQRLGYNTRDVKHIALTHLHLDHAGGLVDFPEAQVHVLRGEYEGAMHPEGLVERFYLPAHWAHGPHWALHEGCTERWFGFDAMHLLPGLSPEVLLVPLPGHTRGHCGIAVATESGWLFHCGDSVSPFHRETDPHSLVDASHTLNILPAWFVQWVIGSQVSRLRQLLREHGGEVELISSHDIYSFKRNQGGPYAHHP